jgi:hypothetical protein
MTRIARALVATAIGMAAALSIGAATAASHPTLSLPITFKGSTAYAHLSGHGSYARERVQITYTVRVAVGSVRQHRFTTAVYRRTATTDAHGSFTRPPPEPRYRGAGDRDRSAGGPRRLRNRRRLIGPERVSPSPRNGRDSRDEHVTLRGGHDTEPAGGTKTSRNNSD